MDQVEHILALKVMRLTRPTLNVYSNNVSSEKSDMLQGILQEKVNPDNLISNNQFLQLPQSFGNIYLGETFSSYICVHNCTTHSVNSVSVKCDLQSNNNRVSLAIHLNKPTPLTLNKEETLDDVIHYEVKEIGTHILVCEVNYVSPAGLPMSFRKFFKFQVLKPLDVKTKFYNAETDEVFLEAQIQNITASSICLEKVELESSESYTVTSLNSLPNGDSVFSSINRLQPQNSCQFLYCIKPIPSVASDLKAMKLANNIGKLDIVWRSSNLAEKGRLQTSQLQRSPIEYGDLKLTVLVAESICKIGEPFPFSCRVTNTSGRTMDLMMNLKTIPKKGCAYTGTIEDSLGTIEPEKFKDFSLTIFPTKLGIIQITDLQLLDVFMKRTYDFEDFLQVYVVNDINEEYEMQKYVKYCELPATTEGQSV
ncbi:unnamed protein product [Diamesa serratosioi]